MAVVKDSAYGNGASNIASVLETRGKVDFFVGNAERHSPCARINTGRHSGSGKASQEQLVLERKNGSHSPCNDPNDLERWTHYDIRSL
jgi:hypothetical protein